MYKGLYYKDIDKYHENMWPPFLPCILIAASASFLEFVKHNTKFGWSLFNATKLQ